MIYIKDNFLDKELFKLLNKTLNNFTKVEMPGKNFWVKEPDKDLVKYITTKLSIIENNDIENILCFFREAKQDQDNTWRIHNDSIISNQKPDRALVLYMSDNKSKSLNGTAFWDLSKWNLKSIIGHKPNRLISYPCEYFHSKYPNEFIDSRVVFVMFYKIK